MRGDVGDHVGDAKTGARYGDSEKDKAVCTGTPVMNCINDFPMQSSRF